MNKFISILALSFWHLTFVAIVYATDAQEKQQGIFEKQKEVKNPQMKLNLEHQEALIKLNQASNKSMQQVSRASKIIGTHVKNISGDNLGDIKDLVLDPKNGQVVYAVVSFGGTLGVGNKLFAIPWKALDWTNDKIYYILNVDKTTLNKAPGFDKRHWPDSSDKWDMLNEEINQFYSIKR
jgi:sporulation protein YlmC with PRC-barrel domain